MNDRLATIIRKAQSMDMAALNWTIRDIQETLDIWRDEPINSPYCQKLWMEFDVYTTERQKRMEGWVK